MQGAAALVLQDGDPVHPVLALGGTAVCIETRLFDDVLSAAELPRNMMALVDALDRVAPLIEGDLTDGIAPRVVDALNAAEPRRRGGGRA